MLVAEVCQFRSRKSGNWSQCVNNALRLHLALTASHHFRHETVHYFAECSRLFFVYIIRQTEKEYWWKLAIDADTH